MRQAKAMQPLLSCLLGSQGSTYSVVEAVELSWRSSRPVNSVRSGDAILTKKVDVNKLVSHFSNTPLLSLATPLAPTTFKFSNITVDQVLKKISKLNVKKSTGPDQIPTRLLLMVAPAIAPSLTSLLIQCKSADWSIPFWMERSQYHPSAESR